MRAYQLGEFWCRNPLLSRWRYRLPFPLLALCASLPPLSLACRPIEISQVGRHLIFLGGHEQTVAAEEIDLIADVDMHVVFGAHVLFPPDRLIGLSAAEVLDDDPRPRQRM